MTCPLCGAECQYLPDGFAHEFGYQEQGQDLCPTHGDVTGLDGDETLPLSTDLDTAPDLSEQHLFCRGDRGYRR